MRGEFGCIVYLSCRKACLKLGLGGERVEAEMSVERRVLQSEWMLNCITVDIMLAFNTFTFANSFQYKTVYRPLLCFDTAQLHFPLKQMSGVPFYQLKIVKIFSKSVV